MTLAAFVAIALIGAVWVAFLIGTALGTNSGRSEVTEREHYERLKTEALSSCLRQQGTPSTDCITKAIESAQERTDSRQDLYVQRDMSDWAWWMVILSGAAVIVSGVGVFYVRRTLEATLSAVKASVDATSAMNRQNSLTERSQRPYVFPRSLYTRSSWRNGHEQFEWPFNFQNHGSGPAVLKRISVGCCLSDVIPPLDHAELPVGAPAHGLFRDAPWYENIAYPPNTIILPRSSTENYSRSINRNVAIREDLPDEIRQFREALRDHLVGPILKAWLKGFIEYSDVFGKEYRTDFCWRMDFPFDDIFVDGGHEYNKVI